MANYESNMAGEKAPAKSPHSAGEVYVSDGYIDLATAIDLDDIIELCKLPPNCVPLDFVLESEDLDSGANLTLTAGIVNTAGDDLETNHDFFVDSDVGQAGGFQAKEFVAASWDNLRQVISTSEPKIVGLKVTTAPAGGGVGAVRGRLYYRAVEQQDY